MIFKDADGKEVVLRGVNTYPKQVVSSHSMRSILRHCDIEWDVECHITTEGNSINFSYYPKDIKKLLHKHKGVFEDLPHGRSQDHGIEHIIELEVVTLPIKIHPYKHPKKLKDEFEKTIK